jgi:hypothetical protein
MSIEAYLDARAKFDQVSRDVSAASDTLARVARNLTDKRNRFSFSNVSGGFPAEVLMSPDSVSMDGNAWPSAGAINLLLAQWHEAGFQMQQAWRAIPKERQGGLLPPLKYDR